MRCLRKHVTSFCQPQAWFLVALVQVLGIRDHRCSSVVELRFLGYLATPFREADNNDWASDLWRLGKPNSCLKNRKMQRPKQAMRTAKEHPLRLERGEDRDEVSNSFFNQGLATMPFARGSGSGL